MTGFGGAGLSFCGCGIPLVPGDATCRSCRRTPDITSGKMGADPYAEYRRAYIVTGDEDFMRLMIEQIIITGVVRGE